jgi:hypothetical protein
MRVSYASNDNEGFCYSQRRFGGRESSLGIATRYGLNCPGIESRFRRYFPHPSRPSLRPTQPPVQRVPGLSWVYSGRGVVLTPHPHLQCRGLKKGRAMPLPTLRVPVAYRGIPLPYRHLAAQVFSTLNGNRTIFALFKTPASGPHPEILQHLKTGSQLFSSLP